MVLSVPGKVATFVPNLTENHFGNVASGGFRIPTGRVGMRKINQRIGGLSLFSCLVAATVSAQTDSVQRPRVVHLDPVVVTGDGHHQHLKASVTPVRVVTAQDFQKTGSAGFTDALTTMIPQVSVSPNSTGAYLHLNGLGNKYVLVLVNGKKLIGDLSGNVDLNRIDLSRVRRVEVLDGAASSLYGSDAIGGVINIITDYPLDAPFAFNTDTRVSGEGQFRQSAGLELSGKGLGSYTSFTHDQAGYFRNNDYEYVSGNTGDVQRTLAPLTSGFRNNLFSQRLTYTPSSRLSLFAEGNYHWHKTYRPNTSDETTGGFDYELRSEAWRWDTGVRYAWNGKNHLQFRWTGDRYSYGNVYEVATQSQAVGDYVRKKSQQMYEAELKGIFSFYRGAVTIAGLDWRNEFMDAVTGQVDHHLYTRSAYFQHEMQVVKDLKFTLGARYDDHQLFGNSFTPKVAVRYAPGRWILRATYSRGYRAPGLDELYYRYVTFVRNFSTITLGNKDLHPEHSNYFSLGAEYQGRTWNVGLTGFANAVADMIVKEVMDVDAETLTWLRTEFPEITDAQAAKTEHYNQYVNSDRGRVYGIQANAAVSFGKNWDVSVNYAWIYGRQQTDGVWQNLERSIRNTLTLMADYRRAWRRYALDINLNARFQSKTYYPSAYENAPGYGLWNLNTVHTFKGPRWCRFQPSIGIENLFNTVDRRVDSSIRRYANFSAGRRLVVGLRWNIL